MSPSVQDLIDRIDVLANQVMDLKAKDGSGGGLDKKEEAQLKRLDKRLDRMRVLLDKAMKRQAGKSASEVAVKDIDFTEDGGDEIVGEIVNDNLFEDKKMAFNLSIKTWRNNCKTEIETLVSGMMDANDDDQTLSYDLVIGWATKGLALLGMPYVKKAVQITRVLFDLSTKHFESTLPKKPSLRETQIAWNKALDQMTDDAINTAFDDLVTAFKEKHDIPPEEETVFGSNYKPWLAFVESFAEGSLLPKATRLKRDFLTLAYRSMPGDRREEIEHIGTVEIVLDYDEGKGTFSFDTGRIDDITPEVKEGLSLQGEDLYGKLALDLPAMMDFRIDDGSWSNPQLCHIKRNSIKGGSKDFYLHQRGMSKMSRDEQMSVYRAFMRARAYNVPLKKVL